MKSYKFSFIFLLTAVLLATIQAFGQGETFSNPNVDYTFALPEAKWKMTVTPSPTSPNVEYVYGDRYDGHLEVRRVTIAKDTLLTDVLKEEEQKLQFRPGFVAGKEENFAGKLKGTVFNFEYVSSGRSMSGRFYFLRSSETTIYILRFTGQKDSIRSLRNQTDSIGRTFGVKQ